jgi:phage terminase large subunit
MTTVEFTYHPRPQFVALHERPNRFGVMVAHRRAGKTVACIGDLTARAAYSKKKAPRYAYIAPFYRQAKDVAWEYLKEYSRPAIIGKPRESELRVTLFNGAWITLYGADNPDAFRGMYFDGVVIDEFGDMRPKLWTENILPTLADRRGWAVFIGTPKGPNHFKQMWERSQANPDTWFSLMLKASESGIIGPEELAMQRGEMDAAEYEQEYECSFTAAIKGAIWADLLALYEHQHGLNLPRDPEYPVQVAMDIGRTDSAAAWVWQERSDGVSVLHHHERTGTDPAYWDGWFKQHKLDISALWLPHDAVAKTFATSRSTIEQFADMGYKVRLVPRLSKQDGIQAARLLIPHVSFSASCADGLSALYSYKRKWNDLTKSFSNEPVHDWASDSSDAFRYLSIVAQRPSTKSREPRIVRPEPTILKPVSWTLDDLWKDHDRKNKSAILRIR